MRRRTWRLLLGVSYSLFAAAAAVVAGKVVGAVGAAVAVVDVAVSIFS